MNELFTVFKQNALFLINNHNELISRILRSNTTIRLKNINISNAVRNYNNAITSLKTKYMIDLVRIQKEQQQQQQQQQQPTKKRKALLIGVNYYGTPYQLNGCINDVQSLNEKINKLYEVEIITDLTNKKPTKSVILSEFAALLESANAGDTIFFAFSGHGSYTADLNRDELDGKDEMIVSSDLQGVVDDDFKAIIRQKLKAGVTLIAIFDSCHSGTMLDLKYVYPSYSTSVSSTTLDNLDTTGTVILVSGCMDNQQSAESIMPSGKMAGAMTWSLLETLTQSPSKLSWNALLTNMKKLLVGSGFNQIPQLSSGRPLDTNSDVCIL